MDNKTERMSISFTLETEERSIFNRVTKSGTIFGGSNEFPTQIMSFIESAGEAETGITKEFASTLKDGFDSLTVSLNVFKEDYHNFGSSTVSSFRIIKTGYNPTGYEICILDTEKHCYNFTHDDSNKLTKAETVKEMKKYMHDYYGQMVTSAKEKLYNALNK